MGRCAAPDTNQEVLNSSFQKMGGVPISLGWAEVFCKAICIASIFQPLIAGYWLIEFDNLGESPVILEVISSTSSDSFQIDGRNMLTIIFDISSSVVTLAAWETRKQCMAAKHFSSSLAPISRNVSRNLNADAAQLGPKFHSMLTTFSGVESCRTKIICHGSYVMSVLW